MVSPPDLERQKEFLAAEQSAVNRRREELLQQMAGFRPPVTTKSAVYEWKESVEKLNHHLGGHIIIMITSAKVIRDGVAKKIFRQE